MSLVQRSTPRPVRRSRRGRLVAATAAVGLASTAIVAAGGGTASAADLPNAQAVGRFLDGAAGGNPIQSLADLQDARAKAPGDTSDQNPLDVKALNAIDLPLTNAVSIPSKPAVDAGVVNQVATANLNGKSLGAAGAVADDGGASLGDDNDGAPQSATINLTGAALGDVTIPGVPALPDLGLGALPGASPAALGGVTGSVGAVYAQVGTRKGGDVITPSSGIASLNLSLESPALGALLTQLKGALSGSSLSSLPIAGITGLPTGFTLPAGCTLTDPTPKTLDFKNGVTIDVPDATIAVNLKKLLSTVLGKDISNLSTSNFDLVAFLVKNLPTILSKGLTAAVTGITDELKGQFTACSKLVTDASALSGLTAVIDAINAALATGQKQLLGAIDDISDQLGAAGGTSALGQLADGLQNLLDIGLNVQSGPGHEPKDSTYSYESNLEATPNQSTEVVENQTLVRAIEINVLDADGVAPSSASITELTGTGAARAVRPLALAPGDGVLNVALANAAAGPSQAPVTEPTTTAPTTDPATVVPATNIPTGIPAGAAGESDGGLPVLPLVAILALLFVGGGAFWQLRLRGGRLH